MKQKQTFLKAVISASALVATGLPSAYAMEAESCSKMETWDVMTGMCMALPMPGMAMKMAMIHGNAFGVYVKEQGPRGDETFASPNMVMGDIGSSLGDHHYVNLNLMTTFEKWTLPERGYPELLQIGENNSQGVPYLDHQHPHSSPVMGLTLSDTVAFGQERNYVRLSFSPRGQSTDGPIAFMHRPTGMVNPDAPLGHHIGQDVGHISSTVIAGSLRLSKTIIEASTFNGTEPEPFKVDLPLGTPNSYALRLIQEIGPSMTAMISAAYVKNPELHEPDIGYEMRYSASAYRRMNIFNGWVLNHALILGVITKYDHASALYSFSKEFLLRRGPHGFWGRAELVQRTSAELAISNPEQNAGHFVTAWTLGYTHALAQFNGMQLGIGGSGTKDLLPHEFIGAYGGNPWSGKVFLQAGGMGNF